MKRIKRLALAIALYAGFTGAAQADFESGLAAYYKLNYETALLEWQPLAEQGDARAAYQMGVLHYRGEGVRQDYRAAAKWFQKAAERGDPDAQYNLGLLYANGVGVTQSLERAGMWLALAAWRYQSSDSGQWAIENQDMAARSRDLVAAQMTSSQITRARRRSEQWQAKLLAFDREAALRVPSPPTPAPVPAPEACATADCNAASPAAPQEAAPTAMAKLPEVEADGEDAPENIFPIIADYHILEGPDGTEQRGPHRGIDIQAPKGTPVLAAADGYVYRSVLHPANGHEIKIKHAFGTQHEVRAQYNRLDTRLVEVGQRVTRGQVIGTVGDSGREDQPGASFLHFALWTTSKRGAGGTCCTNENPHAFWYAEPGELPLYDPKQDYSTYPHRLVYPLPSESHLEMLKGRMAAATTQ
jgi:murein DD-endopeptidase MepM/ murein hydrolase activator NlpD